MRTGGQAVSRMPLMAGSGWCAACAELTTMRGVRIVHKPWGTHAIVAETDIQSYELRCDACGTFWGLEPAGVPHEVSRIDVPGLAEMSELARAEYRAALAGDAAARAAYLRRVLALLDRGTGCFASDNVDPVLAIAIVGAIAAGCTGVMVLKEGGPPVVGVGLLVLTAALLVVAGKRLQSRAARRDGVAQAALVRVLDLIDVKTPEFEVQRRIVAETRRALPSWCPGDPRA